MTTWFFALYTFLVMIVAGPVHQESIVEPLKGRFSYPTADEKSIRDRRQWIACHSVTKKEYPRPRVQYYTKYRPRELQPKEDGTAQCKGPVTNSHAQGWQVL